MSEHAPEHEHDYHAEHPDWPADYEPGTEQDLAVGTIVYVTVVGVIITVLVILLLKHMYFEARDHELALKSDSNVFGPQVELHASQLKQLEGYGWKDAQAGVITIPINQAMSLVVSEYQQGRVDAAPEVAPAAAPDAGAPAAASDGAAQAGAEAPADGAAGAAEPAGQAGAQEAGK